MEHITNRSVYILLLLLLPLLASLSFAHTSLSNNDKNISMLVIRMCESTQFPGTCVQTLAQRLHSPVTEDDKGSVVKASLDGLVDRLNEALAYLTDGIKGVHPIMDSLLWSAYDDCIDLYQDSLQLLTHSRPLIHDRNQVPSLTLMVNSPQDLMTWMTTTCSNHETCMDGFEEANGLKNFKMAHLLKDLSQMVSNLVVLSSQLVSNANNDGLSTTRVIGPEPNKIQSYPKWLSKKKSGLLDITIGNITAHITVSQDGIGPNVTVKTIGEAINLAPQSSSTPFIIYVKAGRYQELNLTVGKKKQNLWFIGDGKGKTIITGNLSCGSSNITTYKTSSFGAIGHGFMARGITFENTAGPENNQAVALLVKSDKSVFYQCEMKGYQDTLYTHSNRQFYRDCDIYGTVDFIFGNAQAVFQNCSIYALKPMPKQKITITAQKRSCPSSVSGISIHESRILAAPDLEPLKANYSTYLGRPWQPLSTVVYMLSYIADHVHPQGWLSWNSTSSLDSAFYGEFMNYGPGANTSHRVQSPGVRAQLSVDEAVRFTVEHFVDGSSWITPTSVPFEAGLGN